jgi:hypothetical protein
VLPAPLQVILFLRTRLFDAGILARKCFSTAMRLIGLAIVQAKNRQRAAATENRLDAVTAAEGK